MNKTLIIAFAVGFSCGVLCAETSHVKSIALKGAPYDLKAIAIRRVAYLLPDTYDLYQAAWQSLPRDAEGPFTYGFLTHIGTPIDPSIRGGGRWTTDIRSITYKSPPGGEFYAWVRCADESSMKAGGQYIYSHFVGSKYETGPDGKRKICLWVYEWLLSDLQPKSLRSRLACPHMEPVAVSTAPVSVTVSSATLAPTLEDLVTLAHQASPKSWNAVVKLVQLDRLAVLSILYRLPPPDATFLHDFDEIYHHASHAEKRRLKPIYLYLNKFQSYLKKYHDCNADHPLRIRKGKYRCTQKVIEYTLQEKEWYILPSVCAYEGQQDIGEVTNNDQCEFPTGGATSKTCLPGYKIRVQPGPDICEPA